MWVMLGGLIRAQCVQNLMRRNNKESSNQFKHIKVNLVPARHKELFPAAGPARSLKIGTREVSAGLAKGSVPR
jgi:hypothetical protein